LHALKPTVYLLKEITVFWSQSDAMLNNVQTHITMYDKMWTKTPTHRNKLSYN